MNIIVLNAFGYFGLGRIDGLIRGMKKVWGNGRILTNATHTVFVHQESYMARDVIEPETPRTIAER